MLPCKIKKNLSARSRAIDGFEASVPLTTLISTSLNFKPVNLFYSPTNNQNNAASSVVDVGVFTFATVSSCVCVCSVRSYVITCQLRGII